LTGGSFRKEQNNKFILKTINEHLLSASSWSLYLFVIARYYEM